MLGALRNAWAQALSALLGIWLMAAPAVLGYGGFAADSHRVVGPVAAAFAIVAIWEHMRSLRWMNLPLGAILVVLPAFFDAGFPTMANSVVVGLLLVGLGFVPGDVEERYGGGWSSLWTGDVEGTDDERTA